MRLAIKLANITIIGVILLAILVLYEIFDYQSSLEEANASLVYYLIPAIIIVFLLASLKLRETFKINLALALISTLVPLYTLELVLVSRSASSPYVPAAEKAGVPFDSRTKLEVLKEYERQGIETFATSPFTIKGLLTLGGISNVLTLSCNETGKYVLFQSDEHGFNNPKGLYDVNNLTLAAIGDSFTQGECVSAEKNAVAIIRNTYPHTLNFGKAGIGPMKMLAILKEYAQPLKPKIVLWIYYEGNDLRDLNGEKKNDTLPKYLEQGYSQHLLTRQAEIDQRLKEVAVEEIARASSFNRQPLMRILLLDRLRGKLGIYTSNEYTEIDLDMFRQVLRTAKDTTSSWGGKLYFVYLPEWQRLNNPNSARSDRDQVLRLVNDLEIPIIDVTNTFAAQPDPLALFPFRLSGHYNEEGYRLFAETVLRIIRQGSSVTTLPAEPTEKVGSLKN